MRIYILLLIYILGPVLIIYLSQKFRIVKKIGSVILAYALGIILSLSGMTDFSDTLPQQETFRAIQNGLLNISITIAIPLLLFNCDFKLWTRSLKKTFATLLAGIAAIFLAILINYFLFRNADIDNKANVAALMSSIYTGGTMNFYALGAALQINASTLTLVYTFQMLITFPFILFMVGGGYKIFRKLLPFQDGGTTLQSDTEIQYSEVENYQGMFHRKTFGKTLTGLGISVLILLISVGISWILTRSLNEMIVILTISTLAILASFHSKIRNLPKTFESGMFFILVFSTIVASQFNIYSINIQALSLLSFMLCIMLSTIGIHLLLCRLFKVPGDLFSVGIIGLFCSPPFIPPVVGAMGNKKVLISGIAIGLMGYAIGTYLGIGIAWLLG